MSHPDCLTIIVAATSAIVAFISLISAIIFSCLQIRHNKNSVKPYCSILTTNYENLISIYIGNSGTGPLRIKKIDCTKDGQKISFMELMSDIGQNEFYRILYTIDDKNNEYSIAAGSRMFLLCISPKDKDVKDKVRKKLQGIKVVVDYADIYGVKCPLAVKEKLDIFDPPYEVSVSNIDRFFDL
jgi:hypothetical protein